MLAWTAFFAFAGIVLALRYWLLPQVEEHRDQIVARVAQTVGQQVRIGSVEAGWLGLRPRISLSDVRIHDAAGREALVLPTVENTLSWRSLFYRELRLHSLVIDGPRLEVRRDAGGALHVAGIKLTGAERDPRFADWLLGQEEIEIRNAEIEWHDEKRNAPPLKLAALNLRLRNRGDEHSVGLTARPPAALGASLDLRIQLLGESVAELTAWNGLLYAEIGYTDLAAWRPWLDYPLDLRSGQGAVRAWVTLERGELRAATADVALVEVVASLGDELVPLDLDAVRGRLQGRQRAGGYEVAARGLTLTAASGLRLAPTDFTFTWKPAAGGAIGSGVLSARLLELAPLAQLSESLPLSTDLRILIAEVEPRGELLDARVEWQGTPGEPQRFSARTRFADLAMHAWQAVPAFSGLSGTVEATQERGRVFLLARNAEIDLPAILPEPRLRLDALNGQIEWERQGERGYTLRLQQVNFSNPHLAGGASGSYANTGSGRGSIDLSAFVTRADGSRLGQYLPHGHLVGGAKVRAWLAASILAGQGSDGQLRLRGDLDRFPFRDAAAGEFRVTARVQQGVLAYDPAWPRIYDIDAELRFEGLGMQILGRSGSILGARVADVRAAIPDLDADDPVLAIAGAAEGATSDFLRFIAASPVRAKTDGMTEGMSATGRGKLDLKIDLPLKRPEATRVAGEYELQANTVWLHRQAPPIERASGKLSFSEGGFALHELRGRALGGPVAVSGGSRRGGLEVVAKGSAVVPALGPYVEERWRRQLSGGFAYTVRLSVNEGATRIRFESPLRGLASALPAPLDKAAADTLPLRVDLIPAEGGQRDRISLAAGRVAAAELLRRRQGASMRLQRAVVWLSPAAGEAIRMPERAGNLVYGSLNGLDLDRWLALLPAGDATLGTSVDLALGNLDVYGKRLRNVALKATSEPAGGWSARVESHEMTGEIFYSSEGKGQVTARFTHFTLPDDAPGARAPEGGRLREMPAIDITAEQFVHRRRQFGRVELVAQSMGDELRVERLGMANADARLQAKGVWRGGALEQSRFDFDLDASDAGRFLTRIGYPELVRGGKAKLQGTLAWQGDPMTLHPASLDGEVTLHAEDGRFLEIEPGGGGRLISLMSLQALPRRVTLDFRDVFSKGFQFDRIEARARAQHGSLSVDEFLMDGSAAEVKMTGSLDLARETQNLRVRVTPSLGDSAALGVAIVNPVAGVAAAIAQRVLKDPLGRMFAYEYAITGGWSDPKVAKLSTELPPTTEPVPQ